VELDERGRSSTGLSMVVGGRGLDSVGIGHGRARGWMEEVRGELARHWAQGNEAGR